jgi:hypothetical protein
MGNHSPDLSDENGGPKQEKFCCLKWQNDQKLLDIEEDDNQNCF